MISLNKRILKVETSKIRQFNDYTKEVGADVILTLGEPDFNTPDEISNEAIKALNAHQTKYGPTPGFLDLRKKICEYEKKVNSFDCTPEEIIITHGSTEALTSALFTMLNPEDEVVVPNPAYPMCRQMVEFMGGKLVTIDTTCTDFQITKEQIHKALTQKTKAIILTSPNNPTGSVFNDATYEAIHQAIQDKPIYVICDDVYNQIIFENRKPGFVRYKDMKDKIIVCQSYSKSYAMPGWRCGYMIANKEFIEHAAKIHQYMIVALNTFIQPAMIKALDYDSKEMVESYKKRRDYIYKRLVDMGLEVKKPEGAFYIFPSIKKFKISSTEFCKRFAEEYKVAIIPGDCFEADDYIRISYCVDFDTIKTACDRLEQFIKTLGEK
ncbi:MAG: aminotransferase class I/II-fold pyridoxal phosphate-dependent enzyme [Anaeroplasmataceae bacterium]|nr:aminotransferase class I/II-fold pyridoxal phosphate-dependent enzyme [Anaeroplasmataceae bacterium]